MARPRIKIIPSFSDKVLDILSVGLIFFLWLIIIKNYADLPQTIPVHFNASGEADRYGSKINILMLPVIATVLFAGLSILLKFPHILNYPVRVTEKNYLQLYNMALKMIRYIKLAIIVIFGLIAFHTIETATGGENARLGKWFLPIAVLILVIPVLIFIIKSIRTKQNQQE